MTKPSNSQVTKIMRLTQVLLATADQVAEPSEAITAFVMATAIAGVSMGVPLDALQTIFTDGAAKVYSTKADNDNNKSAS